ncbi:Hypothetical protein NTJ_14720 [Nesidiocoris tenuis]|uniref:Uncharacterized protein n=1 Tax=Nesidiocoris tenuis TaxID=355587 RepID=A0ABN7BC40_9HEMI|nr:Hypothetical protein NTJ_14720 [Nesidiocoris tenuis]
MSSQQKPNANKSNKPSQKSGSANPPKESANVQKKEPKNTGGGCCGRPHKSAPPASRTGCGCPRTENDSCSNDCQSQQNTIAKKQN